MTSKVENDKPQEPEEGAPAEPQPGEQQTQPAQETTSGQATEEGEQGDVKAQGREAAKYRRQLRDVEAERDQLRERLEAEQRATVERIATDRSGGRLEKPDALWANGSAVADLLDDAGRVDHAKVVAACEAAASSLGVKLKPHPLTVPGEGSIPTTQPTTGWADAFKPEPV
ncbi:hypothetical protein [Knoellia koreensis]|uniref:Uncharacterized protein n=1 Tax=Knoellia koreensis TaxID=2730921 RepID=A0A849HCJ8_9MICO|nr:hypothetical protein [Knoellia sp. DB2414S]NNM45138.1 hypothetical protein [Knoellia sp. DB2414S]